MALTTGAVHAQDARVPETFLESGDWVVTQIVCPACSSTDKDPLVGKNLVIGPDRLVDPLNMDCPAGHAELEMAFAGPLVATVKRFDLPAQWVKTAAERLAPGIRNATDVYALCDNIPSMRLIVLAPGLAMYPFGGDTVAVIRFRNR